MTSFQVQNFGTSSNDFDVVNLSKSIFSYFSHIFQGVLESSAVQDHAKSKLSDEDKMEDLLEAAKRRRHGDLGYFLGGRKHGPSWAENWYPWPLKIGLFVCGPWVCLMSSKVFRATTPGEPRL